MALYESSIEDDDDEDYKGYLGKKDLIAKATPYCDSSFEEVSPFGFLHEYSSYDISPPLLHSDLMIPLCFLSIYIYCCLV